MTGTTKDDLWDVALVIFGEARGEPLTGQQAVAYVVLNRQQHHRRWRGKSLSAICRSPKQFSCFNAHDPNRPLLDTLTLDDPTFAQCLRVALDVLTGQVPDPTGRATHYLNPAAVKRIPAWAKGQTPTCTLGAHAFYAGIA